MKSAESEEGKQPGLDGQQKNLRERQGQWDERNWRTEVTENNAKLSTLLYTSYCASLLLKKPSDATDKKLFR